MAQQTTTCKECGWTCKSCDDQTTLHLHVEIENLKQRLLERERHIVTMETNFLAEADKYPNGEYAALTEELLMWQDKYSRLYESYKRVQKVNQNLEDKLLKIVDKCETEKNSLLREVSSLTQRLVDAKGKGNRLQSENERYRNDVNLAIQLLQCKPTNFVPQKYDSLPADLQQKVLSYVCGRRRTSDGNAVPIRLEMRTIKVPVSTSPPSSMVYSVNNSPTGDTEENEEETVCDGTKPPIDCVSAAIMAKVLEERERERQQMKHCETCTCTSQLVCLTSDQATQTCDLSESYNRTIMDGANRGNQGLVRYVDVVTARNCDTTTKNVNQNECVPLLASNNRLGIRISDSAARNVKLGNAQSGKHNNSIKCQSTNVNDTGHSVLAKSNIQSGYKSKEDATSKNGKSFKEISKQTSDFCNNDLKTGGISANKARVTSPEDGSESEKLIETTTKAEDNNCLKLNNSESGRLNQDLYQIPGGSNIPGSSKENCIIDLEVSADGRSDIPSSTRSKELNSGRNNVDSQNKITIYHAKNSSEGSVMRIRNREGRSFLAENSNTNSRTVNAANSWVRYPSESNKKPTLVTAIAPNEKPVSQVPLPGIVKPTETSISRLSFTNQSRNRERSTDGSVTSGPRLCSMRMQAGTSNILLDNATSYEPILYTSRHSQQDGVEAWGVSASRSGAAVLVHAPRSRSTSASSLDDSQHKVAVGHSLRCYPK